MSSDKAARVWRADTGRWILTIQDGLAPLVDITFLAQDRWIATCGPWMRVVNGGRVSWAGGIVRVWDLGTGNEVFRFAADTWLAAMATGKDERFLSVFDLDSQFQVIRIDTNRKVAFTADLKVKPSLPEKPPRSVGHHIGDQAGISGSGLQAVATWYDDVLVIDAVQGTTRILTWREIVAAAQLPPPPFPGHGVRTIAMSPDGKDIAVSLLGRRNSVYLLQLCPLRLKSVLSLEPSEEVHSIAFDESKHLALATRSGRVFVFNQSGGPSKATASRVGHPACAMRFSANQLWILWGTKSFSGNSSDALDPDDRTVCVEALLIPER